MAQLNFLPKLAAAGLLLLGAAAQAADKPNVLVLWATTSGLEHQPQQPGHDGLSDPEHRPHRKGGRRLYRLLRQQSCTAGRAAFISGSVPIRSGMTKVGLPGAKEGWQKTDVTLATVLKGQGYATGQFGKNHQGDRTSTCPPCTASTSSSAASITSTPRKSRSTATTRRMPNSSRSSAREGC